MISDINLGKQAEAQFVVECLRLGLNISRPHTDFTGYDFIVEGKSRKLYKVQVKATRKKSQDKRNNAYKILISRGAGNKKIYDSDEVDFFAVYLADINLWYMIPLHATSSVSVRIYPDKKDHKFSHYKNAFNLFF